MIWLCVYMTDSLPNMQQMTDVICGLRRFGDFFTSCCCFLGVENVLNRFITVDIVTSKISSWVAPLLGLKVFLLESLFVIFMTKHAKLFCRLNSKLLPKLPCSDISVIQNTLYYWVQLLLSLGSNSFCRNTVVGI